MYGSWPVTVAGHCTLTRGCNCTRSSTRCEPIGSVWARRMSLCRHRIALKFGIPSLGLLLGAPVSRPIGVRNGGVYLPGIGAGMAPSDPRRRGPMLLQDRGTLPRDRQCLRVVALPPRNRQAQASGRAGSRAAPCRQGGAPRRTRAPSAWQVARQARFGRRKPPPTGAAPMPG